MGKVKTDSLRLTKAKALGRDAEEAEPLSRPGGAVGGLVGVAGWLQPRAVGVWSCRVGSGQAEHRNHWHTGGRVLTGVQGPWQEVPSVLSTEEIPAQEFWCEEEEEETQVGGPRGCGG